MAYQGGNAGAAVMKLDSAATAFCADVKKIAQAYREESKPIISRYTERLEEIRQAERALSNDYRAEAIAINEKYREKIERAANSRKAEYAHPEQIKRAVQIVCLVMGGANNENLTGMSAADADNARLSIENAERERLQAEETKARYSEIMPGNVW